ncbi:FMN reductase [Massilia sp. CCM 8734]|nr:FMN reductase [Massilia sp. CCM 8734]
MPHDLVIFSEPLQDRLVNAVPNTRLHRFVKATPARHAAPAPELTRQVLHA